MYNKPYVVVPHYDKLELYREDSKTADIDFCNRLYTRLPEFLGITSLQELLLKASVCGIRESDIDFSILKEEKHQ